ncbi:TetR family transcriptional regulator [Paenarthrobacter sp. NyZ202]|uniref:TetR family transcriptional regulator n=1 Tax=Paenarthrobacter sp. NyZ202 TaxID=3402689 RepID=UPI003CEFE5D0
MTTVGTEQQSLAWNTELTKSLLFTAAVAEFTEYGLAGARMDRIAATASVNKERIYQYFGNKEALFDKVLAAKQEQLDKELYRLCTDGHLSVEELAGGVFDFYAADPGNARFWFWAALEKGSATRLTGLENTKAVLASLQETAGLSENAARELLLTLMTLCSASTALPQLEALIPDSSASRVHSRRKHIVEAVTLLAAAASQ